MIRIAAPMVANASRKGPAGVSSVSSTLEYIGSNDVRSLPSSSLMPPIGKISRKKGILLSKYAIKPTQNA